MGTTRTALAAAFILGMAAPAAADDFCAAVDRVVGDTLGGYAKVRGDPDPTYPASYWSPFALPGAAPLTPGGTPCFVLHKAKTNPPEQYRCYFPGRPDRDGLSSDMHGMADRLTDCLGPMTFDGKIGVWHVTQNGVLVMVGGVLPPPGIEGGAAVVVFIEPAPVKKR